MELKIMISVIQNILLCGRGFGFRIAEQPTGRARPGRPSVMISECPQL